MNLDKAEKAFLKKPKLDGLSLIYSILDKMVKKNIIHQNKAARVKSKFVGILKSSK